MNRWIIGAVYCLAGLAVTPVAAKAFDMGEAYMAGKSGLHAYSEERYDSAEEFFRKAEELRPESPEAVFDTAATLYRRGKYAESAWKLDRLVSAGQDEQGQAEPENQSAAKNRLEKPSDELRQKAFYNLGNSRYKLGEAAESAGDSSAAIEEYKRSAGAFEASLKLGPDDSDAKNNLELARKKLAELEKQQQENKDDMDHDSGGENKHDKKDDGSEGTGDSQNDSAGKQDGKQQEQSGGKDANNSGQSGSQDSQSGKNQPKEGNGGKSDTEKQSGGGGGAEPETENKTGGGSAGEEQPDSAGEKPEQKGSAGDFEKEQAERLIDSATEREKSVLRGVISHRSQGGANQPKSGKDW